MMNYETIKTSRLSAEEYVEIKDRMESIEFKSALQVFNAHRGFRRGELHTLVGTKGSGKSTWVKTILRDLAASQKNTLLYLSEESRKAYVYPLNRFFRNNFGERADDAMDSIIVLSEMDDTSINKKQTVFDYFNELIAELKIDMLIFDNYTTSFMGELNINEQSSILRELKEIAVRHNIPVFVLFHTLKGAKTMELNGDNVRGSATAVNIGSYNYVIHQHEDEFRGLTNFIFAEKSRYHSEGHRKMYRVEYNQDKGIFDECIPITMEDYKEIIHPRRKTQDVFK